MKTLKITSEDKRKRRKQSHNKLDKIYKRGKLLNNMRRISRGENYGSGRHPHTPFSVVKYVLRHRASGGGGDVESSPNVSSRGRLKRDLMSSVDGKDEATDIIHGTLMRRFAVALSKLKTNESEGITSIPTATTMANLEIEENGHSIRIPTTLAVRGLSGDDGDGTMIDIDVQHDQHQHIHSDIHDYNDGDGVYNDTIHKIHNNDSYLGSYSNESHHDEGYHNDSHNDSHLDDNHDDSHHDEGYHNDSHSAIHHDDSHSDSHLDDNHDDSHNDSHLDDNHDEGYHNDSHSAINHDDSHNDSHHNDSHNVEYHHDSHSDDILHNINHHNDSEHDEPFLNDTHHSDHIGDDSEDESVLEGLIDSNPYSGWLRQRADLMNVENVEPLSPLPLTATPPPPPSQSSTSLSSHSSLPPPSTPNSSPSPPSTPNSSPSPPSTPNSSPSPPSTPHASPPPPPPPSRSTPHSPPSPVTPSSLPQSVAPPSGSSCEHLVLSEDNNATDGMQCWPTEMNDGPVEMEINMTVTELLENVNNITNATEEGETVDKSSKDDNMTVDEEKRDEQRKVEVLKERPRFKKTKKVTTDKPLLVTLPALVWQPLGDPGRPRQSGSGSERVYQVSSLLLFTVLHATVFTF
ncbi:hypothetical protein Pmani_036176 [Petrolisthes manimaculis]|uniref:Uncharacterized protein n=1 Tax=Petrolisthes manimaculis TaxID=1843537 RepID=A0AAE1TMC9_9EUCA|nr:hypothetical protein Pmani_036176 [Petrolisthes manimaculis]